MTAPWYGGIEAGGTKIICSIGRSPSDLPVTERIPTTSPQETTQKIIQFFDQHKQTYPLKALGISCFGPLDLQNASPTFGQIIRTPKPGWSGTNLAQIMETNLGIPTIIDTDVNGAAIGEHIWGAGKGLSTFLYFTIGTGIGGGAIVNGSILHGLLHPEMGHIRVTHDTQRDPFTGCCPYHQDCFEGLASGPAMKARWGSSADQLPASHPAWDLEAEYIARALTDFTLTLSPERIILGGGVMQHQGLLPSIRSKVLAYLNGYIAAKIFATNLDEYIVQPGLGTQSGILGAIALAMGSQVPS